MDYSHCDDYEAFLYEMAFGTNGEKLKDLHKIAEDCIEPIPENWDEDELLQQDMDDCWDSEWINPLTGVPHYTQANLLLYGTTLQPTLMEQLYCGSTPEVIPTWELEFCPKPTSNTKKCTFCCNKFGDIAKCKTHTVKQCRVLANTTCLNCGEKGHTVSHCSKKSIKIPIISKKEKNKPLSILEKAGGLPEGI